MRISFEKKGHVGLLLLDDEPRRNALSTALVREALQAIGESRGSGVRAIVIGARGKVFCAGANMREMLEQSWLTWTEPKPGAPTPLELFEAIERDPRPIVAAVDGAAFGGGLELTLACDLLVAGEQASFALPEIGHGVIPNTAVARLPAIVGARTALDLILTRRRITAAEAHAYGLVSRLVAAGSACEAGVALAEAIVSSAPAAIAAVKRAIAKTPDWRRIRAMLQELEPNEWREGFAAFGDKRRPNYDDCWERA